MANISPSKKEIDTLAARHDNNEAEVTKYVYLAAFDRMSQAQGEMRSHGNILFITDLPRLPLLESTIYTANERYPGYSITVITALPDSKAERGEHFEHVIPHCRLLTKWHRERRIDGAILLDLLSPAAEGGQPYLLKQIAKIIVGLLSAPFHSLNNHSYAEVIQGACSLSPIIGLTTATDKITIAKVPALYRLMRKAKSSDPERGMADFSDAVQKSRTLTKRVLEQEATLASVCGPDVSKSFYLLYIQPFTEPWKREEYESQMSRFTYAYDNASTLTVCANGATDPNRGEGLYVQVAAVYPLAPEFFHPQEQALEQAFVPLPEQVSEAKPANGHGGPQEAGGRLTTGGGDR
jgi:hypothetical protein